MAAAANSPIGTELGGYRLESLLGRGGMGVVYRAHDLALDRDVALKLLAPHIADDVAFRERFLTESRLAASLEHPNVIPIHDAGEIEGQLYIAMRLVEGSDLKVVLRDGPLEPARAVRVLEQIAGALDAAHARGLVHRDVKPSNVLLDGREHVYLADFGLSRHFGDGAGSLGPAKSLGTADYVAPEQIRGEEVDGRADVYALGCLLYESLAGEPPFRRDSDAATLFAQLEEPPPTLPGLEEVLPRALAKEPAERYGTCGELIDDVRDTLGIEPRRSHWPLAFAAVGLALIAAALLAFFITRGGSSSPAAQGGRLLRIDPATNHVESSLPVGDGATAVAVGSGRVWVASYRDGTLWQVDANTGGVTKIPAVGRPYAVTVSEGKAYVAALGPAQFAGNVAQFDAVTGGHEGGIGDLFACSLTSGAYGVWAAGCPNVQQLIVEGNNLRIGETVAIPYPDRLSAANFREALADMATGEHGIWVIGDASDRRLWRIDPRRHRIVSAIPLGFPPGGVAVGGGAVWVTDQLGDRLVKVDPAANRIVASVPVGRGAGGVTFGGGSVWVAGAIDHDVTRVDPATTRVIATIKIPASPQAVAIGEGSVWVAGDAR